MHQMKKGWMVDNVTVGPRDLGTAKRMRCQCGCRADIPGLRYLDASRPRFPFRFLQQPRQTVVFSIQYDSCALPEAICIDTWAPSCENMEPPVRTFHYIESFAGTSHCFDAPGAA